jgi:hypothetical protein
LAAWKIRMAAILRMDRHRRNRAPRPSVISTARSLSRILKQALSQAAEHISKREIV